MKDKLVWIEKDKLNLDDIYKAGFHKKGGYYIYLLLAFCEKYSKEWKKFRRENYGGINERTQRVFKKN